MTPRFRLLTTVFALFGCGHVASTPGAPTPVAERRPPRPPPTAVRSRVLDDLLHDDLAADSAFPWSPTRRLTWDDFRGQPPRGGEEVAKTSYSLSYAWKCQGTSFDFRIIAAFRPRQSWVKADMLKDTILRRSALGHEQIHFDLAEVHARRIQRYFGALADGCRKTDPELSALVGRLVGEEKTEQQRYDAETDHGLRSDNQAAWTAAVARRLSR